LDWAERLEHTRCGVALIRTTANLIVRFCPQLRLVPRTKLATQLAELLRRIDSDTDPFATPRQGAVRVRLGGGPASADVTGSSDGWIAFVSGRGAELPELVESENVLGAHAAAAFVASETFKHALPLKDDFAWHAPATAYSVYEYGPRTLDGPLLRPVR